MGINYHIYNVISHWSKHGVSTSSHFGNQRCMDDIILCLRSHMGSYHLGEILMNDLYNEYIDRHGHKYRYDPDHDCYYRVYTDKDLTHISQFGWIYVTVILCAICYYVEFLR